MLTDVGEAYMIANSSCEPLDSVQVPAWNETWEDPTTWKNYVAGQLDLFGK
jgi:hypothetical protein